MARNSPFTLLFFLPMVFAAAFYPLRIFVPVGALDVFAFLAVGDLYGDAEPEYVAFVGRLPCVRGNPLRVAGAEPRPRPRLLTRASRTDPLTES